MRLIDADEVVKFYTNMGEECMELTVKNVHLGGKTAMTNAEWMIKQGYKFIDLDAVLIDTLRGSRITLNGKTIGWNPLNNKANAIRSWLDMEHEEAEAKHSDVKHAHWVDMRLDDVHVCSHCDNVVLFMNGNEPDYCPYCGARMDEDEK